MMYRFIYLHHSILEILRMDSNTHPGIMKTLFKIQVKIALNDS